MTTHRPLRHNSRRNASLVLACGGCGIVAVAVPNLARACHAETICVDIVAPFEDAEFGDFPAPVDGQLVLPATGVRMMMVPPAPEFAREVFADENGCFTFQTEFYTGFRVVVYPEALIGGDQNIHVLGFDEETAWNNGAGSRDDIAAPVTLHVNGMTDDDTVEIEMENLTDLWKVFGMVLFVVERIDGMGGPRLVTDERAIHLGVFDGQTNIGAELGATAIGPLAYFSPEAAQKKFVIAHELGHWFHTNLASGSYTAAEPVEPCQLPASECAQYPYYYDASDIDCRFAGTLNSTHGIRSAEYAIGAHWEGFSHFISTLAFDDTSTAEAVFRYYKEIDPTAEDATSYEQFVADNYRVSMLGTNDLGGQLAWVENMCVEDWEYGTPPPSAQFEISSEIDWMRLWWQLMFHDLTGVSTTKPGLEDVFLIFQLYADQTSPPPTGIRWTEMYDIVSTDPAFDTDFLDRFEAFTNANGVYNGAP